MSKYTNIKKLTGWNIDHYLSLSDESCFICLTEKQRYLLGQSTMQMRWGTRWDTEIGTPLPDIDAIASELDDKMSDESCIDFCAEIIACINDPESGVADSIYNVVNNSTETINREVAQGYNNVSLGGGSNPTCDEDILFGQCLQLVEYLDEANRQILEVIEVATNRFEAVANIVGDITVIDETSIDAVLAWVEFVLDNIAENYEVQITTEYLEQRACDIFCVALDNDCKIDPTTLFEVWGERLSATVTIEGLLANTLNYLFTGSWIGTEIADFMFFAQLAFRSQLGRIIGNIAYSDIDLRLRIYSNDPNPDWTELCTDCVFDWQSTLDLTSSDYGFSFIDGAYSVGVGFVPTVGGGDNRMVARLTLDACTVKKISWQGSITIPSNPDGNATAEYQIQDGGVYQTGSILLEYPGDTPIGTTVLNQSTDGYSSPCDRIQLFLRPDNNGSAGSGFISQITIAGTGTKPSQLP